MKLVAFAPSFAPAVVVATSLTISMGALAGGGGPPGISGGHEDERHEPSPMAPRPAMPFRPSPGMAAPKMRMGATPGGAQDIDFARDRIEDGEVPHAKTFTPEGLLSQHDLPLPPTRACKQILCLEAVATKADLLAQPEVRHIAQLGFSSNLDPETFRRPPLNLVAVVDKSGSMSGSPLETVKESLRQIVGQMTPKDRISVVLYGDRSHVHLAPTPLTQRQAILQSIGQIQSAGSTAMEEGLKVGLSLARLAKPGFSGVTRVMLFTDERPNVGRTDADSFMGMARAASKQGIGMTTVGVSTHFGAELATKISSVRGGNLFFFPDVAEMKKRFSRDFDTMVTELAHDMRIVVEPRPGFELVGLYGVPGDMVQRTKKGGLSMSIETIFLSKDEGGIFFGFAPAAGKVPGTGPLGDVVLQYVDTQRKTHRDQLPLAVVAPSQAPLGLRRGIALVDQVTTLRQASILHREKNETEKAFRLVRALHQRLQRSTDASLGKERALVAKLDETLTRLSGHQGEAPEPQPRPRHMVSGLPGH